MNTMPGHPEGSAQTQSGFTCHAKHLETNDWKTLAPQPMRQRCKLRWLHPLVILEMRLFTMMWATENMIRIGKTHIAWTNIRSHTWWNDWRLAVYPNLEWGQKNARTSGKQGISLGLLGDEMSRSFFHRSTCKFHDAHLGTNALCFCVAPWFCWSRSTYRRFFKCLSSLLRP